MDILKIYNDIIEDLKAGKRGLRKFNSQEFQAIKDFLDRSIKEKNEEQINQALCLLDNSSTSSALFTESLMGILNSDDFSSTTKIYTLGASVKHVIQSSFLSGNRISFEFKKTLANLLTNKEPELVEWTLRTIDEMGTQALSIKEDILKNRPGILGVFNKHQKASRQIVDMLMRKWGEK